MKIHTASKYRYRPGLCHIVSRQLYVMTERHTIYRGSPNHKEDLLRSLFSLWWLWWSCNQWLQIERKSNSQNPFRVNYNHKISVGGNECCHGSHSHRLTLGCCIELQMILRLVMVSFPAAKHTLTIREVEWVMIIVGCLITHEMI